MKDLLAVLLILISAGFILTGLIKMQRNNFESKLEVMGLQKTDDKNIWVDSNGSKYYCSPGGPYTAPVISKVGE